MQQTIPGMHPHRLDHKQRRYWVTSRSQWQSRDMGRSSYHNRSILIDPSRTKLKRWHSNPTTLRLLKRRLLSLRSLQIKQGKQIMIMKTCELDRKGRHPVRSPEVNTAHTKTKILTKKPRMVWWSSRARAPLIPVMSHQYWSLWVRLSYWWRILSVGIESKRKKTSSASQLTTEQLDHRTHTDPLWY